MTDLAAIHQGVTDKGKGNRTLLCQAKWTLLVLYGTSFYLRARGMARIAGLVSFNGQVR